MALSVEYRTCDQEVVGSSLGRERGVKTLGMFLTPMCLCSPSSTSWYRPTGGDALRLGSKGRYGLCMWVAGKTVWSPCYTRPHLSALELRRATKRYTNPRLLYFTTLLYFTETVTILAILSVLWQHYKKTVHRCDYQNCWRRLVPDFFHGISAYFANLRLWPLVPFWCVSV